MDAFHVAIDLDDVMLDFFGGVLTHFEKEFGVKPQWDGMPWGEQAVAFTTHDKFVQAGYKNWWGWLKDRDWLWAGFEAIDGAIGGIKTIREDGCYVEAVTSKPEWAEHNVWKWLGKWRPAFQRVTIVSPGQAKVDMTEADVMVDDKWETCLAFAQAGRQAIWFAPRAEDYPAYCPPGLHHAKSWGNVVYTVHEMKEKYDAQG